MDDLGGLSGRLISRLEARSSSGSGLATLLAPNCDMLPRISFRHEKSSYVARRVAWCDNNELCVQPSNGQWLRLRVAAPICWQRRPRRLSSKVCLLEKRKATLADRRRASASKGGEQTDTKSMRVEAKSKRNTWRLRPLEAHELW